MPLNPVLTEIRYVKVSKLLMPVGVSWGRVFGRATRGQPWLVFFYVEVFWPA